MTPEERLEFQEMKRTIERLQRVEDPAFVAAIEVLTNVGLSSSSKTGASETRSVNESGSANYDVANAPDGFLTNGEVFIPYYN